MATAYGDNPLKTEIQNFLLTRARTCLRTILEKTIFGNYSFCTLQLLVTFYTSIEVERLLCTSSLVICIKNVWGHL